jgi:hypothetical protein
VDRLVGLRGDRIRDLRMRMAERVDGDTGGKIQIPLTIGRGEPYAFSVIEAEIDARECRQQVRSCHGTARCVGLQMKCAASPGGTFDTIFYWRCVNCQLGLT